MGSVNYLNHKIELVNNKRIATVANYCQLITNQFDQLSYYPYMGSLSKTNFHQLSFCLARDRLKILERDVASCVGSLVKEDLRHMIIV